MDMLRKRHFSQLNLSPRVNLNVSIKQRRDCSIVFPAVTYRPATLKRMQWSKQESKVFAPERAKAFHDEIYKMIDRGWAKKVDEGRDLTTKPKYYIPLHLIKQLKPSAPSGYRWRLTYDCKSVPPKQPQIKDANGNNVQSPHNKGFSINDLILSLKI